MEILNNLLALGYFAMWALIIYGIRNFNRARREKAELNAEKEAAKYALNPADPAIKALIDEAVRVINDMLEVGSGASIFSELDYEGFIIAVPDFRRSFTKKVSDYGFCINMHNVSNLRDCRNRYPNVRYNPAYSNLIIRYDSFSEKYNYCYSPSKEGYIYNTRNTVRLRVSDRDKLNAFLHEEVALRCRLADMSGAGIHTKDVAH